MKAYQFLQSLPIDLNAKATILSILFNTRQNLSSQSFMSLALKCEMPEGYKIPMNVAELMVRVNRMVKDKECPNSLKNRFYAYKHKVIKQLMKEGRVSNIYGEGHCYSMIIDGQYQVHQLRSDFGGNLEVEGEREYSHDVPSDKFDIEVYNEFQVAAIYYLARVRMEHKKERDKQKKEKETINYKKLLFDLLDHIDYHYRQDDIYAIKIDADIIRRGDTLTDLPK